MYYGLREKFLRWLSVSIFSETNPGVWPLVAVQEFLCTPVKQWNSIMLHICIFLFNVQSLIHYQFWMWYITSGRKPGFQLPLVIYQHPCREVSAVQLQIPHAFLSLPVSMVRSVHILFYFSGVKWYSIILTSHLGDSGMRKRPRSKTAHGMTPANNFYWWATIHS